MIQFSQVSKRYAGGYEALKNATLTIEKSEFVFLTGHSGAGKSTLLKLVAAIELPSTGAVVINGQNTKHLRRAAIPFLRRNIGLIFQDHKLLYDRSVFENVALPLHIQGVRRAETAKRVRAALDKVGLLSREKGLPITLSGGEQQRVCIARAVVTRPPLVLADEPTANLDDAYSEEIMRMFQDFHQVGVTLIVATHNTQFVDRFNARVIDVQNGVVSA